MARYIDADKFLKELEKQICDDCIDEVCGACGVGCARAIALELPTADVVPKSELAREIFEELEQWLGNYNGCRVITYEKFDEFKKKYTEDKK